MKDLEEYWSHYWENDGKDGEVFVNSKGQKPGYIRAFWHSMLSDIEHDVSILDLACGAGSIFEDLMYPAEKNISLIASDISQSALDIVKRRVPSAKTVCCSCDDLPFDDDSLDLIVSQFGVEYAGVSAFGEAVKKLGVGGRLVFLCHYHGGYIDQRNKVFLEGATQSIESGFIERASDLISASYSGAENRVRDAQNNFIEAEKSLADLLKKNPKGIHQHLYFGFKQLYLKMNAYHESDIQSWLSAMRDDINKNITKVSEIRKVSLSAAKIDKVKLTMQEFGAQNVVVDTLAIPESQDIVAWVIKATK